MRNNDGTVWSMAGYTIGESTTPYIYSSDGGDVNFRYVDATDGVTKYIGVAQIVNTINYATNELNYYYRLSYGHEITNYVDLNTVDTVGNWYCPMNAVAQNLSNCPVTNAFTMKVELSTGAGYVSQTITEFYTGTVYYRVYYNESSSWSDWKKHLDTNHFNVSGTTLTIYL